MLICPECRNWTRHASWCTSTCVRLPKQGKRAHAEGEGDVTFTRTDGRTVTIENVRVDSVGPAGSNPGVVSAEFFDSDDIIHVPFVESWTFSYNL